MQPGRVYGGRTDAERRADRRERLLAAGLELFGTLGWAGTSIERICSLAGVATRSFYEEHAGREQLLLAVYDDVLAGAARAVLEAVEAAGASAQDRTRTGVAAYVEHLTQDPRRARVVHREVRAAGAGREVLTHRAAAVTRFTGIVVDEFRLQGVPRDEHERGLVALALTGAVNEVMADWVSRSSPRPPTAPLVRTLTRLYLAALGEGHA